jgi:hypothetical protein
VGFSSDQLAALLSLPRGLVLAPPQRKDSALQLGASAPGRLFKLLTTTTNSLERRVRSGLKDVGRPVVMCAAPSRGFVWAPASPPAASGFRRSRGNAASAMKPRQSRGGLAGSFGVEKRRRQLSIMRAIPRPRRPPRPRPTFAARPYTGSHRGSTKNQIPSPEPRTGR